jgi:uncharacterized membrane protein YfcA
MDDFRQLRDALGAVLNLSLRQRVEQLRKSLMGARGRLHVAIAKRSIANWLSLTGLCLICASLVTSGAAYGELIMVSIFLAALVSSVGGFGFPAICGALIFHLRGDPAEVGQIMITCGIANQAAMTCELRDAINWRALSNYLVGGMLGLSIGVWILLHLDHGLYRHGLGILLVAYGLYMLFRKPYIIRYQRGTLDFGIGFVGGITGGAAGLPGTPVAIWCGMKGWDKVDQRAVFQPFILLLQIAALVVISLARQAAAVGTFGYDFSDLLFIPASLPGTYLGLALYAKLTDRQFSRAINVLLVASGLSYAL